MPIQPRTIATNPPNEQTSASTRACRTWNRNGSGPLSARASTCGTSFCMAGPIRSMTSWSRRRSERIWATSINPTPNTISPIPAAPPERR